MKEIQDEKDEYDFEDIKNTLDKGNIHNSLNFFLVMATKMLWLSVICLDLTKIIMSFFRFYVLTTSKIY